MAGGKLYPVVAYLYCYHNTIKDHDPLKFTEHSGKRTQM